MYGKPFRLTIRDSVLSAENPFGENQPGPNGGKPIDRGLVYNGIIQGLEKMEPEDRDEVIKALAMKYPQGWSQNAIGQQHTGDSVRDLVHTAMKAGHMGDRIDAMNRANEQFWAEKQRA